jgi:hypothetical protein
VRPTQEYVNERLEFWRTDLNLWAEHVGEEIALRLENSTGRIRPRNGVAAISLEIHLDSKVIVEIHDGRATAAIQTQALCAASDRVKASV